MSQNVLFIVSFSNIIISYNLGLPFLSFLPHATRSHTILISWRDSWKGFAKNISEIRPSICMQICVNLKCILTESLRLKNHSLLQVKTSLIQPDPYFWNLEMKYLTPMGVWILIRVNSQFRECAGILFCVWGVYDVARKNWQSWLRINWQNGTVTAEKEIK